MTWAREDVALRFVFFASYGEMSSDVARGLRFWRFHFLLLRMSETQELRKKQNNC
jgi:hypothetical protein